MISILKSMDELDRVKRVQDAAVSAYALAIRAAAEYVVEFEQPQAEEFRGHLYALQQSLQTASRQEDFQCVQSSFRGELRAYRDQSQEWLTRVRDELQAAAEAMQTLANGLVTNGVDHEQQLQAELQALGQAVNSDDISQVRAAVRSAVTRIAENFDAARSASHLMVAQLHDEIRSLHREIDTERKAAYTDPVSGAWNRRKCDQKLADLLERGDTFCVVIAWLNNFKRVKAVHSRAVLDGALKALVKRASGIVGKDTPVGRWSEDEFIAIAEVDPGCASVVSGELARQLSSRYAIQENGVPRHLNLRVDTVVVDRPAGGDPERFRHRMEQAASVLRGA